MAYDHAHGQSGPLDALLQAAKNGRHDAAHESCVTMHASMMDEQATIFLFVYGGGSCSTDFGSLANIYGPI